MTNAARHLISRANAVSADEIDLMAAARGRAHLEFGLSAAGGPAIAAAVWCAPVELSELWHLSHGTQATGWMNLKLVIDPGGYGYNAAGDKTDNAFVLGLRTEVHF